VFSKAVQEIAWRDLQDDRVWRQGWVWWQIRQRQLYICFLLKIATSKLMLMSTRIITVV
jgi:hypothetical protein